MGNCLYLVRLYNYQSHITRILGNARFNVSTARARRCESGRYHRDKLCRDLRIGITIPSIITTSNKNV
jgi:hypothetical protein